MKRVAYVCADPGIPVFGSKGASVHVQAVLASLLRLGFGVTLHALRHGGPVPEDLRDVVSTPLPAPPPGEPEARARALIAAEGEMRRTLAAGGPFDAVYERYSLWSRVGMGFARAAGVPGILEVNAPLIEEQVRHRQLPLPSEAARIARCAFRDATTIVAVSPGVAAYLQRFEEASGKVAVVANGIDPARFAVAREERAESEPFVVGFLGTLKPWHGVPTLLEAVARVRARGLDARLLIVGDGPQRPAILERMEALGIAGAARMTGAVAPSAVPALLREMDAGVAPYPGGDGFYFSPLKIYEYMAAGLPVVATDVGHLRDLVEGAGAGLVCAPEDPAALAAALEDLARRPSLRDRLGSAARAHALLHCTWDAAVAYILEAARIPIERQAAA